MQAVPAQPPLQQAGQMEMPGMEQQIAMQQQQQQQQQAAAFPPEAQQLLRQAQEAGDDIDDDMDDDQGTRRRGRPRGSKTLNAYITNDAERRKYFVKRIKAIRTQAETFARCTGGNILVVAVQGESGGLHHCGTAAFERFIRDERVAELMYTYLNDRIAGAAGQDTAVAAANFQQETETPEELLVSLIMAQLDTSGLCTASQVCRAWRTRCYMPELWHHRFALENGQEHVQDVEAAFARVGVTSHLDWRALHRDRCIAEKMSPGCQLMKKFVKTVPGFDSLMLMVHTLLAEPTERIDAIRWTIVEHLAQFGLNDMWQEADAMMADCFQDAQTGICGLLPQTEQTFERLEQHACVYHNWQVYDFLLTKMRHLVPEYRTAALLARARMVFQEAHIPETWTAAVEAAPAQVEAAAPQ
jgi:hypothetical protein